MYVAAGRYKIYMPDHNGVKGLVFASDIIQRIDSKVQETFLSGKDAGLPGDFFYMVEHLDSGNSRGSRFQNILQAQESTACRVTGSTSFKAFLVEHGFIEADAEDPLIDVNGG